MNVGDTVDSVIEIKVADPSAYPSVSRALTDPTTLVCLVTSPAGVATTYTYPATITRTSIGVFYLRFLANEAGTWLARWTGTGAAAFVETKRILVGTQAVA